MKSKSFLQSKFGKIFANSSSPYMRPTDCIEDKQSSLLLKRSWHTCLKLLLESAGRLDQLGHCLLQDKPIKPNTNM